ncbi:MAG TPA: hypothetical protein VGO68_17705 [Pyrinomonadaceae bacterium]|jgi:hypothetical protein|nr:hypothetical protein [Pyrinomonadaceae bacterium]
MLKNFRALALILIALMIALSLQSQAQQRKGKVTPPTQAKNKLQELANRAGGHFTFRYQPKVTVYPNVEELAKRSDIIVIGRTLGHRSMLTADGNFINQEVLVRVQEVVKGDPGGPSLVITVPGGAYRFDDGSYAIVEPIGQRQPENQNISVFFLKSPGAGEQANRLRLSSEVQGIIDLTGGKTEPSSAGPSDPFVARYKELSAVDFLRELHKAVPRKVKAGK